MSFSTILEKTRTKLAVGTVLASSVLPLKADIVQVNGIKYDVKDTDKGPTVTDVLTNSQVSDPGLFFKAVETNLTLDSLHCWRLLLLQLRLLI